ncbi:DNA replication/repair protein RecF [Bacillota bacterium LX-D]|nr:DNA replication/repair protein RecF [Bacillota bacterium LX-D]
MYLQSLDLQNFTNYTNLKYYVTHKLNILVGKNAQGKSNLLEAIYYLSSAHSGRYPNDLELIKWGSDFFQIKAEVGTKNSVFQLRYSLKNKKKELEVNGTKSNKVTDIIGLFNVVLFSPDDLFIVKGTPALRRRYLDNEIIQVSPSYYHYLLQYRKILLQRNNLLKNIKLGKSDTGSLDVWESQLAKSGAWLISKRLEMLQKIKPLARLAHRRLTSGQEELEIIYKSTICQNIEQIGSHNLEKIFLENLQKFQKEDTIKGYTTIGPQRDDFELKINGLNANVFGSQGQQRTVALSLKIAELEFMFAESGEYPVLLLDDVLSELDKNRREQLLSMVSKKIQTFITCTDLEFLNQETLAKAAIAEISGGKLQKLPALES